MIAELGIQFRQLVHDFRVFGISLERGLQSEDTRFQPARCPGGFLQGEVRLFMLRFVLQNFFDLHHGICRILLDFTLQSHDRDRRGGKIEKTFFADFNFATSVRRNNCRPVKNSGSCFRIACSSEIA
ncbi:MAG: hypothetical protein M3R59_03490 [Verrucomicrobiota bacterium]|nr:hypothetical protein [Verrucomicrobiota bacterium]